MKRIVYLMVFLPMFVQAQNKTGIRFEGSQNWQLIIEKARKENKPVFVDCYTTWCLPCKKMEKEVYESDSVGGVMNEKYISVKLQMDTSKNDKADVQKMYGMARSFEKEYKIKEYPTFLLFSPEGILVHKDFGYKNRKDFVDLMLNSLNPDKQFYTLLNRYNSGKKDYDQMHDLAIMAKKFGETEMAGIIAEDYINNRIFHGVKSDFYKKENIEFINSFSGLIKQFSKSESFKMFLNEGGRIDSILGKKGYSLRLIDFVISKEEISPSIAENKNAKPDWKKFHSIITKKYAASYADRIVLNAQIKWYRYKEEWPDYVKYMIKKVENYGAFGVNLAYFDLNNHAWEVFKYSNDKTELSKALQWSDSSINLNPGYSNAYDTNANLLYKLGKKDAAIAMEEKAIRIEPNNQLYVQTLQKMKQSESAWPSK